MSWNREAHASKSRILAPGHPQTSDRARLIDLDASTSIFQLPGPENSNNKECLELEILDFGRPPGPFGGLLLVGDR